MRLLALFAFACSGCVYQELTAPHVEPGGTVSASLSGAAPLTSTGLADATGDPFHLNGFSPFLTFGLIAGDFSPGAVSTMLMTAGNAIDLQLQPGGRNVLEIHAGGSGCTAQSGVVHLRTTDGSHVAGDFSADGVVTQTGAACAITGTLDAVPISR